MGKERSSAPRWDESNHRQGNERVTECVVRKQPMRAQKKSRATALLGISFQLSRKTRQSFVLVEAAAISRAGGLSPSRDLDRFDTAPDRRRLSLSCVTAP
jgi:hypothetical protein